MSESDRERLEALERRLERLASVPVARPITQVIGRSFACPIARVG